MKLKNLLAPITSLPLIACAATASGSDVPEKGVTAGYICKADDLQALIGEQANTNTGEIALKRSKAKKLRWITPGSAVTMDHRQDRLNISYDENMTITQVNCG